VFFKAKKPKALTDWNSGLTPGGQEDAGVSSLEG
jgi:hypothetical protein